MSSGQLKPHRGFNSVQIRDGYVVRLNKNGTVRATLGKYGQYRRNARAYARTYANRLPNQKEN
jgi:hypothetical protein